MYPIVKVGVSDQNTCKWIDYVVHMGTEMLYFKVNKLEEGDIGDTQYSKKNWQIPKYCIENQWNNDTTFRSLKIGHAYLKLHPSNVFINLKHVCTICSSVFWLFL